MSFDGLRQLPVLVPIELFVVVRLPDSTLFEDEMYRYSSFSTLALPIDLVVVSLLRHAAIATSLLQTCRVPPVEDSMV